MAESTFAERAEEFYGELGRERYLVGAGLKETLDLAPIYARYADLFAEPAARERVAAMRQSAQSGEAVQARHLADFAVSSFIGNTVNELTEAITNAELNATVEWKEQAIPYRNVRSLLVREGDYERRHDLDERALAVLVKQNPLRAERIQTQHDAVKRLGFPGYRAMIEQLRGWDLPILSKALEPLVKETDGIFEEKLGRYLSDAHVPRGKANRSDLEFILRAPEYDTFFPGSQLVRSFETTVAGMGMPLDSTPGLHIDADPRPQKSPRAFCESVRVPDEIYLVVKPAGGQHDYRTLFHEGGHSEHYSHIDANLPFAFRYLGEEAITESFAFLFEEITQSPRWLVDVLRVPLREAERYQRFGLFGKSWRVRRQIAKLRYEIELHDAGPSGMDTAYRDILGDVLHINITPERYLEDVDDGFYCAGYLRAWIFERQLELFVLEHFGDGWYESVEAGKFLRSLWSPGLGSPVDELARTRLGAKGLDPLPLMEELADF